MTPQFWQTVGRRGCSLCRGAGQVQGRGSKHVCDYCASEEIEKLRDRLANGQQPQGAGLAMRGGDPITVKAVNDVISELTRARNKFPTFGNAHEGYAVILEELDELWDEIKKKNPSREELRAEAMQVAAMGLRFMIDVCSGTLRDEP